MTDLVTKGYQIFYVYDSTIFKAAVHTCLFGGFKVLRDVIHDHYIPRPNERGRQVGKEGVRTPKSYSPLGVLPWELIKSGTRAL